jgi:ketosteroid isomerase-like protein
MELDSDRTGILNVMSAYHDAMVAADIAALVRMLDPRFILVHITGYVQSRNDWFEAMAQKNFDYHSIQVEPGAIALQLNGDKATLSARGIFYATINGADHPWRLQFSLQLEKSGPVWKIRDARYSTF